MEDRQFAQPAFLQQPQPPFSAQTFPPFFPQRRFFPIFFISPLLFPFARDGEIRDEVYAQHPVKEGDSAEKIASMYNIPQSIMELTNPHIQNFQALPPGSTVYIPRMDKMYCQKMYLEQEVQEPVAPMYYPMQQMMPTMQPTMSPMQHMMQMSPLHDKLYPGLP